MGRTWIGMETEWGASRGGGDAGVMLMWAQNKTGMRLVVRDHAGAGETSSFLKVYSPVSDLPRSARLGLGVGFIDVFYLRSRKFE
jgi:hypothetical protein